MTRDERPTTPPGPADADADAFAHACREHEHDARLDNLARLQEWHAQGRRGTLEDG